MLPPMHMISLDLLEDTCRLSPASNGLILLLGFALWIGGWQAHRFWIVLIATACAGMVGLRYAAALGSHPLIVGLLLAATAGLLALALVRVLAFAAGGAAAWFVVRSVGMPGNEPLLAFLVGGLLGLLLFRLWTMALTSGVGSLLILYSGLSLGTHFGKLQALELATTDATMLNGVWAGLSFLGLIVQLLFDRWRRKHPPEDKEEEIRITRTSSTRSTRIPRLVE